MYRFGNPEHTMVIRESDGANIPVDVNNADFAACLAWCQNSPNEIAPYQKWADITKAKAGLLSELNARARLAAMNNLIAIEMAKNPIKGNIDTHTAAINALTTPAQAQDYNLNTGWPA